MHLIDYEKLIFAVVIRQASANKLFANQLVTDLTSSAFSSKEHKEIFRAIKNCADNIETPNIPNILIYLKDKSLEPYLRSLLNFPVTVGVREADEVDGFNKWLEVLHIASCLRALSITTNEYATRLNDFENILTVINTRDSLESFLSTFIEALGNSGVYSNETAYQHIKHFGDQDRERFEQEKSGVTTDILNSGWPSLQEYGLPTTGVLHVLGGLTSAAKTTLALHIMLGVAINLKLGGLNGHCAYNAMEESGQELYRRAVCILAGINSQDVRRGKLSAQDELTYNHTAAFVDTLPVYFDDTPHRKSSQLTLESQLLQFRSGAGPRVLGVSDYSELFGDEGKDENKRLKQIAQRLHLFARDTGSSEWLITQYPDLYTPSQIGGMKAKESRAIGQAGKCFIEIYNVPELMRRKDAFPNFDENQLPEWVNTTSGHAYILIHKNSRGRTGRFPVKWTPEFTQFRDLLNSEDNLFLTPKQEE